MDTEKQKQWIIHFLYYTFICAGGFIFLRYILYMLLPFMIGFAIAFLLRPLIRRFSRHGHERSWSIIIIIVFYGILGILIAWLMIQGFFYIREWMLSLPSFYQEYIEPNLQHSLNSTLQVWKHMDEGSADFVGSMLQSLQHALSSFVGNLSCYVLQTLATIMTSIPNVVLSFFFAILSSFFFNSDYHKITAFITQHISPQLQVTLLQSQRFIKTALKQMLTAYSKLMCLTFFELCIGLYILGVKHALWIALGIAVFDIIPILGTGGIMIPWAMITYFHQQQKLAVGLIIVYLIITIIRNIVEPRIVGHQIGLHPLIMLVCMYLGGKVFGVLGIFVLPFVVIIFKNLYIDDK